MSKNEPIILPPEGGPAGGKPTVQPKNNSGGKVQGHLPPKGNLGDTGSEASPSQGDSGGGKRPVVLPPQGGNKGGKGPDSYSGRYEAPASLWWIFVCLVGIVALNFCKSVLQDFELHDSNAVYILNLGVLGLGAAIFTISLWAIFRGLKSNAKLKKFKKQAYLLKNPRTKIEQKEKIMDYFMTIYSTSPYVKFPVAQIIRDNPCFEQRLDRFKNTVLKTLDEHAEREVLKIAAATALLTAATPGFWKVAMALFGVLAIVQRVQYIYTNSVGFFSTLNALRDMKVQLFAGGTITLTSSVVSRSSNSFWVRCINSIVLGVATYTLIANIGIKSMQFFRPMNFSEKDVPTNWNFITTWVRDKIRNMITTISRWLGGSPGLDDAPADINIFDVFPVKSALLVGLISILVVFFI